MTGLRTRAVRTMGRSSVVMLSLTVALLVAPSSGATPESDAADTAITAAWHADGGADGELGDKDGGLYQVGEGFGQNFADGKIYYTQRTGAHHVHGAVLDKYQAVGGPADSDLGFPTDDEGAGKAQSSRNSTFSAADDPVIFWTPDNGAWVVRGAINAAWDKLGGSAGTLGVPTADETWKGGVVSQTFTGGEISWDTKAKTFTTSPADLAGQLTGLQIPGDATTAIAAARRAAGGPLGPLGTEEGSQYKAGDKGVGQNYSGGAIFYSPDTGATAVVGPILDKYRGAGGPQGDLGLPTGSDTDGSATPTSRTVTFAAADQPAIVWTQDHGAFIVRGAMNAAWSKLGGLTGKLGAPTADQTVAGDVVSQKFSGGSISWNSATQAFTADPSDLTAQLADVKVPSQDLTKSGPGVAKGKWYQFHWWWLLAIIPLVLAVGALAIAAVLRRRRRSELSGQSDEFGPYDQAADHDEHPEYDEHHEYGDHPGDDEHHDYVDGRGGEYADDHYGDEHFDDEHHDQRYGDAHFGDEHFGDEHYPDEHLPDQQGVASQYHAGSPQFQDDPDAVDTAPNAIASLEPPSPPESDVPQPHAPGWAGLGAGLGAAGLGAAGVAAGRAGLFGRRTEEPLASDSDHDADGHDVADATPDQEAPPESAASATAGDVHDDVHDDLHDGDQHGDESADLPAGAPGAAAAGAASLGAAGIGAARAGLFGHHFGGQQPSPVAGDATAEPGDQLPSEPAEQAEPQPESDSETEPAAGPPSGRHHAVHVDEPETAQMSFRVALGNKESAPEGYEIKADTKSGHYWVPGSPGYDAAPAEIWFASEDFAITNGFIRG